MFPEINSKYVPSNLLNFRNNENILNKISNYTILLNSYKKVKYAINSSIEESVRNPCEGEEYSQAWAYLLKSINNFELLCPPSAYIARDSLSLPKIKINDNIRIDLFKDFISYDYTYEDRNYYSPAISITIGHMFTYYIGTKSNYRNHDYIYEVDLQDVFNLLFHIYCNGSHEIEPF